LKEFSSLQEAQNLHENERELENINVGLCIMVNIKELIFNLKM
jgi:hypothetical protein